MELPLTETTELEERMHEEFKRRYGCDPIEDTDAQVNATYDRTSVMWTVARRL